MKISNPKNLQKKDLIVFDLDGTVAPSKSPIDADMQQLLPRLLEQKRVAIISGGEYGQFKIELLNRLKGQKINYENLFLFPTCSAIFYRHKQGRWHQVYAHNLTSAQVKNIMSAFRRAYRETGYRDPKKTYGPVIQNRKTQVTFSALGQKVVHQLGRRGVALKENWKKHHDVRP